MERLVEVMLLSWLEQAHGARVAPFRQARTPFSMAQVSPSAQAMLSQRSMALLVQVQASEQLADRTVSRDCGERKERHHWGEDTK